jgi:sugar (pentulose or hexulose) kinase
MAEQPPLFECDIQALARQRGISEADYPTFRAILKGERWPPGELAAFRGVAETIRDNARAEGHPFLAHFADSAVSLADEVGRLRKLTTAPPA